MRAKALRPESTENLDATQVDLVAKKRALMSEMVSTMSANQVLERDIERLRQEIVTTGMNCFSPNTCEFVLQKIADQLNCINRKEWRA